MIVPATVHRLPCPRYVQVVEPDDTGKLPPLLCPHRHELRFKVKSWTEYGFICEHPAPRRPGELRGATCGAQLWLISLPGRVYVLCEVTPHELEVMAHQRMQRWEQLAFLWRVGRYKAA